MLLRSKFQENEMPYTDRQNVSIINNVHVYIRYIVVSRFTVRRRQNDQASLRHQLQAAWRRLVSINSLQAGCARQTVSGEAAHKNDRRN